MANDNHVNPGYNYYFLRNPALAYDPVSNPVIASLGTPEGNDPNTLRSAAHITASARLRVALTTKITLTLDIVNAFANASPTQLQSNPYLIGPPGYAGGNATYAAAYGPAVGSAQYVLGNGVPTNNGRTPSLPWRYGTAGYLPASYSNARAVYITIGERL